VLVLVLAVVALGLLRPVRVAAQSLLILPEVLPDVPLRPLLWFSVPPERVEFDYESATGPVESDVYLPADGGPHGAIILYTGAFGLRHEPAFVRFAEALARSGAVVMVPESAALRAGDIAPEEVDGLLKAVAYLRAHPRVDPARIGIFGFSAGGSIVLLAAETDIGRDEIAFANIFGAYFDAGQLLREVASHEIDVDGQAVPWHADPVTVFAVNKKVIESLADPVDRELLSHAFLDELPETAVDPDRLSPEGRLVLELLEHPTAERVDAILAELPPATREHLAGISPSRAVSQLRTRLFVMHDRSDTFVPFTHSRELAARAPAETVRSYVEFDLFGHVMPNRQLDAPTFAGELVKLFRQAWLLGREVPVSLPLRKR
jgi:acetyl esterase/lipase